MKRLLIMILVGVVLGWLAWQQVDQCATLRDVAGNSAWVSVSPGGRYTASIGETLTIFDWNACTSYSVEGWVNDAYGSFGNWSLGDTYFIWGRGAMGSSGCIRSYVVRSRDGVVMASFGGCIGISPRTIPRHWLDDDRIVVQDLFCPAPEMGCYFIYSIRDGTVANNLTEDELPD